MRSVLSILNSGTLLIPVSFSGLDSILLSTFFLFPSQGLIKIMLVWSILIPLIQGWIQDITKPNCDNLYQTGAYYAREEKGRDFASGGGGRVYDTSPLFWVSQ